MESENKGGISMKLKVPKNFSSIFEFLKAKYNKLEKNPFVGKLWWNKPETVLWLYATNNEEDYEGHQTQFGVDKEGTVVWGFFSHCSCNYYGDYEGDKEEVKPYVETETQKQHTYELENVPTEEIGIIVKTRLRDILKDFRRTIR